MKALRLIWIVFFSIFSFACTHSPVNGNWRSSGALLLSRQLPTEQSIDNQSYLGFMPFSGSQKKTWLKVKTDSGEISLMSGNSALSTYKGIEINGLKPGLYSVALKQRNPLWHATDSYFESRKLDLPPSGSAARFLKAALGDNALFAEDGLVVHSGSTEVQGLRLSKEMLQKIYNSLNAGDTIVVE